MQFRFATAADADAIAKLHAESWRSAFGGIISDEYLEARADEDRLAVWRERLSAEFVPEKFVLIAEENSRLFGFSIVFVESDATYGSLLDNLHVAPHLTRQGIGRRLLSESARELGKRSKRGLFLWVMERNLRAQQFYGKAGAEFMGSELREMPDGRRVMSLRCYWPAPQRLIL
jgi:ribosomal protein S18 acetylase RimI-like enzyme